jgi:hypothetical protein
VGVDEETGTELFYYFIESEWSVSTDPLILWLTGGPRCTVFSGLAFEVGPVKFVLAPYSGDLPQLVYNPLSWTKVRKNHHPLFLRLPRYPLPRFCGSLMTIIRWQASSSWIRLSARVSRMRMIPKVMMSETTRLHCKSKHF